MHTWSLNVYLDAYNMLHTLLQDSKMIEEIQKLVSSLEVDNVFGSILMVTLVHATSDSFKMVQELMNQLVMQS